MFVRQRGQRGVRRIGAAQVLNEVDGSIDLAARHHDLGDPLLVLPAGFGVQAAQFEQIVKATRLEQRAQAKRFGLGIGEDPAPPVGQHQPDQRHQSVGPVRGQRWRGTQVAPELAQAFDVGRVIVLVGLEQAVKPFSAQRLGHPGSRDQRHQLADGGGRSRAQRTR